MTTQDTPILAATKTVLQLAKLYIGSGEDCSVALMRSANEARKEVERAERLKESDPE